MRYLGGVPENPEAYGTEWIERQMRRYQKDGTALAVIEDRESGNIVGQCGIICQKIDGVPEWEVGYHLLEAYRGKGYASEAARACRDVIFKKDLGQRAVSIIMLTNTSSQKVARRTGMRVWKRTSYQEFDVVIYKIERSEWEVYQEQYA